MDKKTHLINFIIDSIVFFISVVIFAFLLKDFVRREDLKVLMIVFYYLYYFIFELTTGQTVGKMFTKTIVVTSKDGAKPKFINILIRTLVRLIPIDFLSYIFTAKGLHDLVSKTELKRV